MVNYHDPATIVQEYMTVVKLWHVTNGIFIWEFFTTLYFEWEVFRGKRPYVRTIWAYSIARLFTLVAVIISMISFDTTTKTNCQALATSLIFFSYVGSIPASLLIVLRVIAVWQRQKIVIVITMGLLLTDVVFMFNTIVRFRSTWSSEAGTCLLSFDGVSLKLSSGGIFFTDLLSLSIMLVGLLRMRREVSGAFRLGRLLWKQGLIWILIATISEIPTFTFMILDLNVPMNLMFQGPCMIVLSICATRMYRSLHDFCSSDVCHGSGRGVRAGTDMSVMRVRPGPIPVNVSVGTAYGQFPTTQSSYVSTAQDSYKTQELSLQGGIPIEMRRSTSSRTQVPTSSDGTVLAV